MSENWTAISFQDLEGWRQDDHIAALSCFRMSAKAFSEKIPSSRIAISPSDALLKIAEKSLSVEMANLSQEKAREFFETHFQPHKHISENGFVTAYFEPEVRASRVKTNEFSYPIYSRPDDLVKLTSENRPENFNPELEYARQTNNGLVEYYDRKLIDEGALAGRGFELFWVTSDVEAFYIHIQGSARLIFQDGTSARISYAGKTGHPYTSIGKLLVSRNIFTVEEANMTNMRKWLAEDKKRATQLLHENRSYIFFAEVKNHNPDFGPTAAAGVQLTPGRSLAVDKTIHAYGTPIWISTQEPLPFSTKPYQRLMIAQDTGSAIIGPQRGDLFIGSGKEAGMIAGAVRHKTGFFKLEPKE